jgi:hypothetical protein
VGNDEERVDNGDDVVGAPHSRARFLARLGGVGFALLGGGEVYRWVTKSGTAFANAAETVAAPVRRFVTRPDLRPPAITVAHAAKGTASGLLFLAPPSGPGQRGALIVDNRGDTVWFHPTTPKTTMGFRAGFYKGKPVLSWWEGRHVQGVGKVGEYVIVDDSYREIARFKAGHGIPPDFHELLLTPEGTALVTAYDPVAADLSTVGGPRTGRAYDGVVQEIEIPSARVLFEWRSLDHVGIEESYSTDLGDPFDYFHVNSIGFDHDGHLLISARNTWTIYKVHRRTGRVIWRLGGKKSDFAMGPNTSFAFQHDARSHDKGGLISMFDNGPRPNAKPQSRALVLALDTKRKRATLARQTMHSPPLFAFATGNAQRMSHGGYLVCWGVTGQFTEYAGNGATLFDAKLPKGGQNYRVLRFPWRGQPRERPKLTGRVIDGSRRLWATWNGATEVVAWQLLTGSSRADLQPGSIVARRGFETKMTAPDDARYVAVVALDRDSNALARSNVIRFS